MTSYSKNRFIDFINFRGDLVLEEAGGLELPLCPKITFEGFWFMITGSLSV